MVLAFYGASGLGTEFRELARVINEDKKRWDDFVFIDDNPEKDGTELAGLEIMTFQRALDTYGIDELEFIISIGEPAVKDIVFKKLQDHNCTVTNLIHPEIRIPHGVKMGVGIVVHRRSPLPPMSIIGNNVLIQAIAVTGHNLVLGDNVVISSLSFVGGDTTIGRNTYVAPHCCIRNGLTIGEDVVLGMGSVVMKDIPDRAVAYGNPCKVVRINEKGRVFSK